MRSLQSLPLALLLSLAALGCEGDEELVIFRAALTQVNPQQSASTPAGLIEVVLQEESNLLEVELGASGLDDVNHPTFLWSGDRCPTEDDDANGDGIVDIAEAKAGLDGVMLALDGDLTDPAFGPGFPTGSAFTYQESAPLTQVIEGMGIPHVNPLFTPLLADDDIDLERRFIVVHGVGEGLLLPTTPIVGIDGFTLRQSVPVLCGRLVLVETLD
jgi:hypothetical protein